MRKLVLSLLIIFSGLAVKAQVKGNLIDSASKKPMENAVVALVVKSNPTDTSYTFTDDKGVFKFDVVPTSPFSVVTFTGMRPENATGTPFAICLPNTIPGLLDTTPIAS